MDVNTNLSDYTIDELFSLLDITIKNESTYDELVSKIKTNTDKYIDHFTKLNKQNIVDFFKNVQYVLLNSSKEKDPTVSTVITYRNDYTYGTKTIEYDENIFNSNSGAGNPINRKTVTKMYTVDTRFRSNYYTTTSTNFLVDIPEEQKRVIEMKLSDIEIPTTFYTFNNAYNNNYMWMKIIFMDNNIEYLYIYIPEGNYSTTKFMNTLNSQIKQYSEYDDITAVYDLSYVDGVGEGTGLVSFNYVGTNIKSVEINFTAPPIPNQYSTRKVQNIPDNNELLVLYIRSYFIPLIERLGWILGFRNGLYNTTGNNNTITSESILDITGPKYVYLSVDDHRMGVNTDFKICNVSQIPNTILARIAIKVPPFSIQVENDLSVYAESRYYYGPVNITKLDIKLLDEHGRIVNLNNRDFSFTLKLTVIYSAT
jgi:hypothetical protein